MCILLGSVAGPNHLLKGFALHVYKPTVQLIASHSLCLVSQVVTFSLGDCSLYACANLLYPTISYVNICSTLMCVYMYDGM